MPKSTGCRDCSRCTETWLRGCLLFPVRLLFMPFIAIRWRFMQLCPQCGHPLKWHSRDASGRFKD